MLNYDQWLDYRANTMYQCIASLQKTSKALLIAGWSGGLLIGIYSLIRLDSDPSILNVFYKYINVAEILLLCAFTN